MTLDVKIQEGNVEQKEELKQLVSIAYRDARARGLPHSGCKAHVYRELPTVRALFALNPLALKTKEARSMRGTLSCLLSSLRKEFDGPRQRSGSPAGPVEPAPEKRSVLGLYREYCQDEAHEFVPLDADLSFFSGATREQYAASRAKLKADGYEFARVPNGWAVTKRPPVIDREALQSEATALLERVKEIARTLNGGK